MTGIRVVYSSFNKNVIKNATNEPDKVPYTRLVPTL